MSGDHNTHQKLGSNDLKECGTCGYPLLPEERTGLVEVNGKMFKPWAGLTDEEIENACWTEVDRRLRSFARAIEAKLKEKNGG